MNNDIEPSRPPKASYLSTHPYVRILVFGTAFLIALTWLNWQFGAGEILGIGKGMLVHAGFLPTPLPQ